MAASRPTPELDAAQVRALLRYDPASGLLYWRDRFGGRQALCTPDGKGYLRGKIGGVTYKAHRVAWLIVMGRWPCGIDHLNGDRGDNRWANLRAVTASENNRNKSKARNNTSGATGVSWHRANARWQASIKINGRLRHLGYFTSVEAAKQARDLAAKEASFSERHGR